MTEEKKVEIKSKVVKPPPKKAVIPNISSLNEATVTLADIGEIQRRQAADRLETENEIAEIKKRLDERLSPDNKKIEILFEAVFKFAQSKREELTQKETKKFVRLLTGEFGWRTNPPSVKIDSDFKEIDILKSLETLKLENFIRRVPELNKEEILKHPEVATQVKGIEIISGEEMFFLKPSGVNQEFTQRIKKPAVAKNKKK